MKQIIHNIDDSRHNSLSLKLDQGLYLKEQGKLQEAVNYYQELLNIYPDSSSIYYYLGIVYYDLSNFSQAIECLIQAIHLQPNQAIYYYNYAVILQNRGLLSEAINNYQKAIFLGEKNLGNLKKILVDSYINLAKILFQKKHFEKSITLLQKAKNLQPDYAPIYHNLAQVFTKTNQLAEAITYYRQCLKLQPDLVSANYSLAKLLARNHLADAEKYFRKVLEIDPKAHYIYADLGEYFLRCGKLSDAFLTWKNLTNNHIFLKNYLSFDRNLKAKDQLTQAQLNIKLFIKALQKFDGSLLAKSRCCQYLATNYWHLGNALMAYAEIQSAENYYYKAIAIQPKQIKLYLSLAECLGKQKRFTSAITVVHMALKIQPGHPQVLEYLDNFVNHDDSNTYIEQLSNQLVKKCDGLNCQDCLNKIFLEFSPIYCGKNLYQLVNNNLVNDFYSVDNFQKNNVCNKTAILPEGRAWHIAQENYWLVCSSFAIINNEDQLVWAFCREYPGKLPDCENLETNEHRFLKEKNNLPNPTYIKGRVAVITGLSANVYFHWFVDILPRLLILQKQGYNWSDIDWFLVNSYQLPFQRETLRILGIPQEKILESDRYPYIQASELIVPAFAGNLGWLTADSLQSIRQIFLPFANSLSINTDKLEQLPKRIYLSRQKARYRSVLNETEVLGVLSQYGFVVICPENLSVVEQIQLFSQAEIIIGPHGSALTNIIFCSPGTKILEFMPPVYIRHYYWVISRYLKLEYYYLLGENFVGHALRHLVYQNPLTEDLLINLEYLEHSINYLLSNVTNSFKQIKDLKDSTAHTLDNIKLRNDLLDKKVLSTDTKLVDTSGKNAQIINPISNNIITHLDGKMNGNVILNSLIMGPTGTRSNHDNLLNEQEGINALLQDAYSLMIKKQFVQAEALCRLAIQLAPNYAPTHKTLGNILQSSGNLVQAWECYQRAISLQPDYGEAYANLGTICAQKYQWQEAIAYYEKALSLHPNLEAVQRNLARAKARLSDHSSNDQSHDQPAGEKPRKEKIVIGSPTNGLQTPVIRQPVSDQLADINTNNNEYVDLANNALASYKVLGDLLQEKGKPEEAWQWYQKAITLAPQDPEIYLSVGNLYTQQGQWQEAIKCYQKCLTLVPNYAPAYRQLAQLLTSLGRWDDATKCWYQAYAFSPETATAEEHFILGNTLLQMNRGQEAVTAYCRAIELNPALAGVYEQLGVALKIVEAKDQATGKTTNQALHLNQTINHARNLSPTIIANMDGKVHKKGFVQNTLASLDRLWQGLFKKSSKTSQRLNEQDSMGEKAGLLNTDISSHIDVGMNINESDKIKEDYQYYGNEGLINTYWQFNGSPQRLEILPVSPQPTFSPVAKITPMLVNRVNWQNSQNSQSNSHLPHSTNLHLLPHNQDDSSDEKIVGILKPEEKSGGVSTVKIAQTNVQSTVTTQTPTAQFFLQIAEIYYRQAKYQEAITQCDQALTLDDRSADAYMIKGNAWLALGNLGEAEKAYRQSLHCNSKNAAVYSNLGTVYAQQKLWSRAIASWQKAISVKPDFAAAYRNLGKAWGQIGRLAESADCWYQAYSYEPTGVKADQYLHLANLLTQQGQITQAIDCYERAIQLDSQLLDAYQGIRLLLQKQGKWQEADVYGQRLRELGGNIGNIAPAVVTPVEPVAINPQRSVAYHTDILVQKQSVIASIDQANTVTNNWREKATLAIKQGDLAGAIACYQELMKVDSQSVAGPYNLGQIYRSQKRWSEAIACYQQALKIVKQQGIQPDLNIQVWEIYQNLGDTYQENGQVDEAINAYQQALDLSND